MLALSGMVLVGRKHWAGWALVIASEVAFVVLTVILRQWGLLPASAALLVTYGQNLARWRS